MKKTIVLILALLVLTACGNSNSSGKVKKNEVTELPYVLIDQQSDIIDDNGEPLYSYVKIEKLTRRELTPEENNYYFNKMDKKTISDLNERYEILELDFGSGQYLEEHNTNQEIYFSEIYLVQEKNIMVGLDAVLEEEIQSIESSNQTYGFKYSNRKYKYLVEKNELSRGGVQLWLKDDLYLNIPKKEK